MVGIKIGEYITFDPTGTKVKVASDDSVEYENRIYKLSPFVGTFMPDERKNSSNAYQGSKYFSYNGKILTYGSFCRIECAPIPYKHRHSERFKVLSCKIELFNSSIGHFAG